MGLMPALCAILLGFTATVVAAQNSGDEATVRALDDQERLAALKRDVRFTNIWKREGGTLAPVPAPRERDSSALNHAAPALGLFLCAFCGEVESPIG